MNPNLQPCPDCGREVSKRAASCPNCGCPLNAPPIAAIPTARPGTPRTTQTIEATGKQWKLVQLAGGMMMLLGMAGCWITLFNPNQHTEGFVLGFVGLAGGGVWIVGRLGSWWYHG